MKNNKPKKLYKTILADPPWDVKQRGGFGAVNHYSLMTIDQIKAMPVGDLADPEGSHCWLWITAAVLPRGEEILNAWGFQYRGPFFWVKPRLGLGEPLRNSAEIMLLGQRGKVPVRYRSQPNWGFYPVQDHSHKPEEQFAVIERISPGPYLELFARRRQPGWDCWGNEIDSDIIIPGYPVPSDHGKEA